MRRDRYKASAASHLLLPRVPSCGSRVARTGCLSAQEPSGAGRHLAEGQSGRTVTLEYMQMSASQLSLSETPGSLPEGFEYRAGLISPAEERELVERFGGLDFKEFEFQGYRGKRRTISFGLHYDFSHSKLRKTEDIPAFLQPLRAKVAGFARIEASNLPHVLVTDMRRAPGSDGTGTGPCSRT